MSLDQQPNTRVEPWQAHLDEISKLEAMLKDIDTRLSSFTLNLKEMFALGAPDLAEERYLFIEPNDKLSKNDLLTKREAINAMIAQKRAEIAAMQAQARQELLFARQAKMQQKAAQIQHNVQQAIIAYEQNPTLFFADVLNIRQDGPDYKKYLFASADKIIAVCPYFAENTEDAHLWAAWKIVAAARDLAAQEFRENLQQSQVTKQQNKAITDLLFKTNEHYVNGAKLFFQVLLKRLPKSFIGLQFLYQVNLLERVQHYLELIYTTDARHNAVVMSHLMRDVEEASERQARRMLSQQEGFKGLNAKLQTVLLQQQNYLVKLMFDVYKLPDDIQQPLDTKIQETIDLLKTFIRRYQDNIINAVKRTITLQQNTAEEMILKSDIEPLWAQLRKAAGIEQTKPAEKSAAMPNKKPSKKPSKKSNKKSRRI